MDNARKFLYVLEYIKEKQESRRDNPFVYSQELLDNLTKSASDPAVNQEQLENTLEYIIDALKELCKDTQEFLARLEIDGLEWYSQKELDEITLKEFEELFEKPLTDGAGLFD